MKCLSWQVISIDKDVSKKPINIAKKDIKSPVQLDMFLKKDTGTIYLKTSNAMKNVMYTHFSSIKAKIILIA